MGPTVTITDKGDWHEVLGRVGFVAKGILYGIVAVIAIAVALGDEKNAADPTGALSSLADSAAGTALLVALAIGLAALAAFRLVEVFTGPEGEEAEQGNESLQRIVSLFRFLIYGGLAVTAVRVLGDSGKGGSSETGTTKTVFDLPAGVAIVFAVGVVIIGIGLYLAYRGLSTSFEEGLETERMSPAMCGVAKVLGVAGHVARAIVFVLVGAFLIKAAVEYDPKEAIGLDGALQEIAQEPYGSVLLMATAAGLLLFGAFCLVEARWRKL